MKRILIILSLVLCLALTILIAKGTISKAANPDEATLLNTYGNTIGKVGTCSSLENLSNPTILAELKKQYNSIVLENQSKPDALLGGSARCISVSEGKNLGYYIPEGYSEDTVPTINFDTVDKVMKICAENGFSLRIHTLVWHSQTPDWFFREGFGGSGAYVSKDKMDKRMEFYVKSVINHIQSSTYSDIVYSYDVVNEYIHASNSGWLNIYGNVTTQSEMVKKAFTYAHEALVACGDEENVSLLYNDYNTYMEVDKIIALISYINSDEKICDGIGMQSHLSTDFPSVDSYGQTLDKFAAQNYEIQITELDVGNTSEQVQAEYMYNLMSTILKKKASGAKITSLTYWGHADDASWRKENNPLLFSTIGVPKQSFTQVIKAYTDAGYSIGETPDNNSNSNNNNNNNSNNNNTDDNSNNSTDNNNDGGSVNDNSSSNSGASNDSSTNNNSDSSNEDATDNTPVSSLTDEEIKEADSVFSNIQYAESYKKEGQTNPIVTQRFGADPGVMVYNDTVYVVTTHDSLEYDGSGNVVDNTYSKINTLNLWSSKDLVNWTDHGVINAAGSEGAAKWAGNSWAPTMCHKEINGSEKFFIYFANNANGVGVLTSDSPTGPWTDPIGKALISRQTANCSDVTWLFDPAVLVDDDGTGYLYFGGGVPDGQYADPGTARVVKLGDDMVSLDGDPVKVNAPYLFEDAGINKIGDKYYYSYCSNFNTSGNNLGISGGAIEYCVSNSPMGPFTYAGEIFKNPGTFFGSGGNNHHTIIELKGSYYLFYHTQVLQDTMGISGGYRSTQIDKVSVDASGNIENVTGTLEGTISVNLQPVSTNETIEAETIYRQGGIAIKGTGNTVVTDIQAGDWTEIANVDLSNVSGKQNITLKTASSTGGYIKICVDDPSNEAIGYIKVPNSGSEFVDATGCIDSQGKTSNLVFVYGTDMEVDSINFGKGSSDNTDNNNNSNTDDNADDNNSNSNTDDSTTNNDDNSGQNSENEDGILDNFIDSSPQTSDTAVVSIVAIIAIVSVIGIIRYKRANNF